MENTLHIFAYDVLQKFEECRETIISHPDRLDGIVVRLESLLSVTHLLGQTPWEDAVGDLIQAAVDLLTHINQENYTLLVWRKNLSVPRETGVFTFVRFSVANISKIVQVSVRTIRLRMSEHNLTVHDTYSIISEEMLQQNILEILASQTQTEYKRMKCHLLTKGIKVTNVRVRHAMRVLDPLGVYKRTIKRNHVIRRRECFVQFSNNIWHIDANLKLVRWGFVIHCGIDGKNLLITYISVSTDNRADTHYLVFM